MTSSEAERLNALEKYNILDTTCERAFDDINRLAAQICGTPIALLSLIDNTRQWFKSKVGLSALEIARNMALCNYTIQQTELLVIQDALTDERFATNPLVTSAPNIRFYAGVPLITPEGYAIGTLCVMDRVPRKLSPEQKETLQVLSHQVVAQLELRRSLAERKRAEELLLERSRLAALNADVGISLTRSNTLGDILEQCAEALVRHLGVAFARIWTLNIEENVLELQVSAGIYTHINGYHSRVPVGQFKIGLIAQERQPHLTNSVIGDPRVHDQEWAAREGLVAFAGYPLIVEEQVVGVMAMFARQPLSEDTLKAMASVANGIALGIQRKQAEQALRESEKRFRSLSACSPVGIFLTDTEGLCTYTNPRCQAIAGLTFAESLGEGWAQSVHPDDREWVFTNWSTYARGGREYSKELRLQTREGIVRLVHIRSSPMFSDKGELIGHVGTVEDITERKRAEEVLLKARDELEIRVQERTVELTKANQELQTEINERKRAEEALKRREQEFKALVEHAPDIIARFNKELRHVYVNPAVEKATGISPQTFIGKTNAELEMSEDLCEFWEQKLRQVFETKQGDVFEFGFPTSSETRYYQSRLVPEFANDGSVEFVLSIARNITALKQAEAQLIHDAFHDVLTGLPNRALFMDRLECALGHAKRRADYLFAVLFLDLDRFKLVNDSLGHVTGDQLLIAIARRLETCLRSGDTVARLGGDEFTILLDDIKDVSEVTRVADRIHKELTSPFNLSGYEVFTNVSIGIALSATGYNLPEELLRDADIAMYRAKALGKARYEVFGKDMHTFAVARLQLEMDLRRAIERQEFRLHYQPIVSLETGKINGFEALARWQHPDRGLIFPTEFIPVAEETGLIVPIGQWVLRESCAQMNKWQEQSSTTLPLTINVNLSGKQLAQPDLIEQIAQILQETNFDAHSLRLEITESVLMENVEAATSMLLQLRALGVHLHMDDFGTGYSSLSYLRRFPMDILKIDRSFVSRMGIDAGNLEIVQTIVMLAHSLGIKVTAEGVETEEQLAQLRKFKCDYGQGSFFSKPLNSEMAKALIAEDPHW